MGMSVAFGRNVVTMTGSLLTQRAGWVGAASTPGSSAAVTRRCLERPSWAPSHEHGPCNSHMKTRSLLPFSAISRNRDWDHTERKKPVSRSSGWSLQGPVLCSHWALVISHPSSRDRGCLIPPLFQRQEEYLPTDCLTDRNLSRSLSSPDCSLAEISGLHASQGPFD